MRALIPKQKKQKVGNGSWLICLGHTTFDMSSHCRILRERGGHLHTMRGCTERGERQRERKGGKGKEKETTPLKPKGAQEYVQTHNQGILHGDQGRSQQRRGRGRVISVVSARLSPFSLKHSHPAMMPRWGYTWQSEGFLKLHTQAQTLDFERLL